MNKGISQNLNYKKNTYISTKILLQSSAFILINMLIYFYILYLYDFQPNVVTLLFLLLTPLLVHPVIVTKDIMNPFSIFIMSSQSLFIYNMIDVNANKTSLRYGSVHPEYFNISFAYSVLIIIIWYIVAYSGYNYADRFKTSNFLTKFNFTLDNPKLIAIGIFLISILSFIYTVADKGGISGMILSSQNRVEEFSGQAYLIKLVLLGTVSSLILLVHNYKKISFIMIIITFFMLSLFGGRGAAFGGSILPFVICYHYRIRRIKIIELAFIGGIALLFIIYYGHYRLYQNFNIELESFTNIISNAAASTQSGDILPALVGSLRTGNIPYSKGRTLLNVFFAPIPRTLWAKKPIIDETGVIGKLMIGKDGWGLPPGTYGIAYFNFGIIGVITFGFITGIFVRQVYKTLILKREQTNESFGVVVYAILIGSVFNIFSTSAQINIIWYGVTFLLIKYIDKIKFRIK